MSKNHRINLEKTVRELSTVASGYNLLGSKNRWVKKPDKVKIVNLVSDLGNQIDLAMEAKRLESRASGFIQGGLFGLGIGGVAVGLASLAQSYGLPGYMQGFCAGAIMVAGLAYCKSRWPK